MRTGKLDLYSLGVGNQVTQGEIQSTYFALDALFPWFIDRLACKGRRGTR